MNAALNRRRSEASRKAAATVKRLRQVRGSFVAGANSQPPGAEPGSEAHKIATVGELLGRIRAHEGQ